MPKLYRTVTLENASSSVVPFKRTKNTRQLPYRKPSLRNKYAFNNVHSFKRTTTPNSQSHVLALYSGAVAGGGINATSNFDLQINFSLKETRVYVGGASYYNISNAGYAEFANLFDFYRIDRVSVKWDFSTNSSSTNTSTVLPMCIVLKDFNDSAAITYQVASENGNAKTHILGNDRNTTWTTSLVPRVQNLIYNGATSAYAESVPGTWLNTTYTDVPHYGVKFVFDPINYGSRAITGYLYPTFTYYISCKNQN